VSEEDNVHMIANTPARNEDDMSIYCTVETKRKYNHFMLETDWHQRHIWSISNDGA